MFKYLKKKRIRCVSDELTYHLKDSGATWLFTNESLIGMANEANAKAGGNIKVIMYITYKVPFWSL